MARKIFSWAFFVLGALYEVLDRLAAAYALPGDLSGFWVRHMSGLSQVAWAAVFVGVVGVLYIFWPEFCRRNLPGKELDATPSTPLLNPEILRADYKADINFLILWVSVTNVGTRATSMRATGVHVTFDPEGRILVKDSHKLNVKHPPKGITFYESEFSPNQAIYELGVKKIKPVGGRIAGYISAELPNELYDRLIKENGRLVFVVEDAVGTQRAAWITVDGQKFGVPMQHIPGLKPKRIGK